VRGRAGALPLAVDVRGGPGVVALVGPNGSGKTTLLRVLLGAHPVREAEIVVAGRVLTSTSAGEAVPMEARGIGYVPQGLGLFPHLSAADNVAFGLTTRAGRASVPSGRRQRVAQALAEVGAAPVADRPVTELSGGERQRVALARALVLDPPLLLLDEPMAALDAVARRDVRALLARRLRGRGRPSVLVTHDARDVEAVGAEVWVMEAGRIVQQGSLRQVAAAPATPFAAAFAR